MDEAKAQEILASGKALRGDHPEDVAHIEYAVGLVVSTLNRLQEGDTRVLTLVEFGKDDEGLFVSYIYNTPTD